MQHCHCGVGVEGGIRCKIVLVFLGTCLDILVTLSSLTSHGEEVKVGSPREALRWDQVTNNLPNFLQINTNARIKR